MNDITYEKISQAEFGGYKKITSSDGGVLEFSRVKNNSVSIRFDTDYVKFNMGSQKITDRDLLDHVNTFLFIMSCNKNKKNYIDLTHQEQRKIDYIASGKPLGKTREARINGLLADAYQKRL